MDERTAEKKRPGDNGSGQFVAQLIPVSGIEGPWVGIERRSRKSMQRDIMIRGIVPQRFRKQDDGNAVSVAKALEALL